MSKYEYRVEEYSEEYPLEDLLNDVGPEGWRLAALTDPTLAVLEREYDE